MRFIMVEHSRRASIENKYAKRFEKLLNKNLVVKEKYFCMYLKRGLSENERNHDR